jgi:pantetheine-phosphate adenylyltransferase
VTNQHSPPLIPKALDSSTTGFFVAPRNHKDGTAGTSFGHVESPERNPTLSKRIAVYPGSFDPITNGHVDLIDRVSRLATFDELVVLIAINPTKTPRFTLEQRIEMLETVIQPYPNVRIDQYSGLTALYAQAHGACVIIRGLREVSDFDDEFKMARMNQQIAPEVDTLFMMANIKYAHLSSSLVMQVGEMEGTKISDEKLLEMVPPGVLKMLREKLKSI